MKKYIKKTVLHPLISGSIIITAGSLSANFFNFLFNLFMSRNLSVQDYGTLASLMAIITLFGISATAVMPTLVSFTAESFSNKDLDRVRAIYFKVAKPFVMISGLILLVSVLFRSQISDFLNVVDGEILTIVSAFIIFISFASVLNNALLQARLSFFLLSFLNNISSVIKLLLGLFFVFSGFKTLGALSAILTSYVISYVLSFMPLKFLLRQGVSETNIDFKKIVMYAAPSGVALLSLTSIISIDVVLVKHLFEPKSAGIYAGIALVGKVIFFLTAPIGTVMFPLISKRYSKNEHHEHLFLASMLLVVLASISLTLVYFLFPEPVLRFFLKNTDYLVAASLLGFFGVFITLHSICSIMMYYFLSIKKTRIYIPILASALIQAIAIYFVHSTFSDVILISTVITAALLSFFIFYYLKTTRRLPFLVNPKI